MHSTEEKRKRRVDFKKKGVKQKKRNKKGVCRKADGSSVQLGGMHKGGEGKKGVAQKSGGQKKNVKIGKKWGEKKQFSRKRFRTTR